MEVATLEQPLAMAVRSGDPALYVAEKTGRVVAVRDGGVDPVPVLDLTDQVSLGGEQGLLGLAFSPDGRHLYVNYTDTNGDTHVTGYAMGDRQADAATRRDVLVVDQPYANHNGGNLAFGPDGYLYIGLGDGGSGGDPEGNGQSLSTLLGKMLRIDPTPSGDSPYRVPADNPFVGRAGRTTGDLGLRLAQPVAVLVRPSDRRPMDRGRRPECVGGGGPPAISLRGRRELRLEPDGRGPPHTTTRTPPANAVPPVYEYSHDDGGCVVTGGYVYRGGSSPICPAHTSSPTSASASSRPFCSRRAGWSIIGLWAPQFPTSARSERTPAVSSTHCPWMERSTSLRVDRDEGQSAVRMARVPNV